MARSIPSSEPDTLIAGDTWRWQKSFSDFTSVDGWELSYSIRGAMKLSEVDVVVAPIGNSYDVTVAAAKTGILTPGTYQWAAIVTNTAGERYTADRGSFVVERNLTKAEAGDAVAHAERMLFVLEAVLSGRITADIQSYQIAGRAVTKIPVMELKQLRSQYRTELWKLRNPGRLSQIVEVGFARPR